MKIMFVTPFYAPSIGGVQKYIQTLVDGLKQHHTIVVVTSLLPHTKPYEVHGSVTIYRLAPWLMLSNTPINPLWYGSLRGIIKRERPDIINAHAPVPFLAELGIVAAKHIPTVFTYHAGSILKGHSWIDTVLRLYENHILPRIIKKADKVVAIYPDFVYKKTNAHDKVAAIPPGVDTTVFHPGDKPKHYDVVYVGRVEMASQWKGIDVLLKAVALVKARQPNITVRIVGGGDATAHYKVLAKELGIVSNIRFIGAKYGRELVEVLQASRILVLPSKTESESFGIVLAEAMACGVPVVGSHIGGIPNVIEENKTGLLVSPDNPPALAEAIAMLLSDTALQHTFSTAGRKRVVETFSSNQQVTRTETLFRETVKQKVVHVSANYVPRLGGLERVVEQLAFHEQQTGQEVQVITSRLGYYPGYQDSVDVTRLSAFEIAHTPIMPTLFLHLLRLQANTIVHIHIAQAFVPELVLLASKLKRFSYIAHVHLDIAPSGKAGFLLKIYKPLVLKRVLHQAKYVVVFSEEQQAAMIQKYTLPPEKVKIIPNGVDASFYHPKPRTLHAKPKLLFVGRLDTQKNLTQLLRALDGMSETFETAIVGEGELSTDHKALAAKLQLKHITFHGRLDGEQLKNQYRQADIFVLPSEREGMPLVLLEALAMRLPIVGTDVPGIRDLVTPHKNGLLAPLHDVTALRDALVEIRTNKADMYARMSKQAHVIAKQYSWENVARQFEELYRA